MRFPLRPIQLLSAALCCICWSSAQAMTLAEALDKALVYDPTEAVSLARFAAEREAGIQERATLKPSINANGAAFRASTDYDGVYGDGSDVYDGWEAAAELRQPLFRLDWFARLDRAQAQDAVAQYGLEQRRLGLYARVAERYFEVLQQQDAVDQAEAAAQAVRGSLDDTRKRYEVELVPGTDLKEAQARDDLAQASLITARKALDAARDALAETTGEGAAELPRLAEGTMFPPLAPAQVETWLGALRGSPELALAREQVAVAEANVRSRRSSVAPSLDLVASAGRNDTSDYEVGQRSDDARVSLQLQVPIYAGGSLSSAIREAQARLEQAQAEVARTQLESERRTRQLFRDVTAGYGEVAAYRRALESARAAEQATRYGYEAGTRTITETIDAQSRRVNAQRNYNSARYALLLNIIHLKQTVGLLAATDFSEVDRLLNAAAP